MNVAFLPQVANEGKIVVMAMSDIFHADSTRSIRSSVIPVTQEYFITRGSNFVTLPVHREFDVCRYFGEIHGDIMAERPQRQATMLRVKQLRALISSPATSYAVFLPLFRALFPGVMRCLRNSAAQPEIAIETCITLAFACKALQRLFSAYAELIMPQFIRLLANNRVAPYAHIAAHILILHSESTMMVPMFTRVIFSTRQSTRRPCMELLCDIVRNWSHQTLECCVNDLCACIRKGAEDRYRPVRMLASMLLREFEKQFPERAAVLVYVLERGRNMHSAQIQQNLPTAVESTVSGTKLWATKHSNTHTEREEYANNIACSQGGRPNCAKTGESTTDSESESDESIESAASDKTISKCWLPVRYTPVQLPPIVKARRTSETTRLVA